MKHVLVLGAFGLVGFEISKHLINSNHNVIVSSRSLDKYSQCIDDLSASGSFIPLAIDTSSEDSLLASISYFKKNSIVLSGVVNAVSYRPTSDPLTSTDIFKDVVLNSSLSLYLPCSIYGDYLASLSGGSIISFSSIYGIGAPLKSLYSNTSINTEPMYPFIKGGILSLSRYFASYYADRDVRFNCISPGGILNNQDPNFQINYSHRVPIGRMAFPLKFVVLLIFFFLQLLHM